MFKDIYYDYKHDLYNNNLIKEFLLENYGENIIKTYRKDKLYSCKCDFARYRILYK